MGLFDRKVTVHLTDDVTGETLGTFESEPDALPETFTIETTLHLGGTDWSVIRAEPETRAEYASSRTLALRLRRVEWVNLDDILYSLPSICDRLPAVGTEPLAGEDLQLAEDDWRQLEFVSRSWSVVVDTELACIRRIHEEEQAEAGWRKLHVRGQPDPPILATLTLDDITHAFMGAVVRGLGFWGTGNQLASGFSLRADDGMEVYGELAGERVIVLGLVQHSASPSARFAATLAELAERFDLELVRWNWCERSAWDGDRFRLLLGDNP